MGILYFSTKKKMRKKKKCRETRDLVRLALNDLNFQNVLPVMTWLLSRNDELYQKNVPLKNKNQAVKKQQLALVNIIYASCL